MGRSRLSRRSPPGAPAFGAIVTATDVRRSAPGDRSSRSAAKFVASRTRSFQAGPSRGGYAKEMSRTPATPTQGQAEIPHRGAWSPPYRQQDTASSPPRWIPGRPAPRLSAADMVKVDARRLREVVDLAVKKRRAIGTAACAAVMRVTIKMSGQRVASSAIVGCWQVMAGEL